MPDIQDVRIAALQNILTEEPFNGSQADLGRALGKKSGAIIYQMLNRIRPISEKTARDIEARLRKPKGWMDRGAGQLQVSESAAPYVVEGRALTAREEIIMDLVCGLTPEQQEELLPTLRAAFDANRSTQKLIGTALRTVGNRRIESEFGRVPRPKTAKGRS